MDEPLSNLDAKLRVQTRTQIASLQRRLGVTTVYVTHDQVEAMTMGDRVAVLKDGLLQQCDSPRRMYDHPDNVFVAGFIGSPAMNLLDLPVTDGGVQFGDALMPISREDAKDLGSHVTRGRAPRGPRPHRQRPGPARSRSTSSRSSARTRTSTASQAHLVDADARTRRTPSRSSPGSTVAVPRRRARPSTSSREQGHLHMFNADSGLRIGRLTESHPTEYGRGGTTRCRPSPSRTPT